MSLLVKFNLILVLCFGIALIPAHLITRDLLERNARTQVVAQARLMMQTALATRGYTNKQIKPLLAARLADEFLPQTVPAYSATEIFNSIRETHPEYSYKEATLNPTNPRDRTVDWEADIVNGFRQDKKLKEVVGERDAPLGRALYLARPITITDPACLSCHTSPEATPVSLITSSCPATKPLNTMTMSTAADVMIRPDRCRPSTTASPSGYPSSCSSTMRESRNTS